MLHEPLNILKATLDAMREVMLEPSSDEAYWHHRRQEFADNRHMPRMRTGNGE